MSLSLPCLPALSLPPPLYSCPASASGLPHVTHTWMPQPSWFVPLCLWPPTLAKRGCARSAAITACLSPPACVQPPASAAGGPPVIAMLAGVLLFSSLSAVTAGACLPRHASSASLHPTGRAVGREHTLSEVCKDVADKHKAATQSSAAASGVMRAPQVAAAAGRPLPLPS